MAEKEKWLASVANARWRWTRRREIQRASQDADSTVAEIEIVPNLQYGFAALYPACLLLDTVQTSGNVGA